MRRVPSWRLSTVFLLVGLLCVQIGLRFTSWLQESGSDQHILQVGGPFALESLNLETGRPMERPTDCTVIYFCTIHCAGCGWLADTLRSLEGDGEWAGVRWLMLDPRDSARAFATTHAIPNRRVWVLTDAGLADAMSEPFLSGTPTRVLMDADAVVRDVEVTAMLPSSAELAKCAAH